jgi:S1-C subfamily serine protease
MTNVDWGALVVVGLMAITGARRGLIASALGLAGIVAGAVIGARLAPHLLGEGSRSPYTPLIGLAGAVVLAGVLQGVGQFAGSFIRSGLRLPPLRTLDTAGGVLVGAAMGFGIVWVLGAVALHVPGQTQLREAAQRSAILQRLNEIAPPDSVLRALSRIDPFPLIAGPPTPTEPLDPRVLAQPGVRRAAPSVVRVLGTACGLGVSGSGWVYRRGYVVTAAHVVAGQTDTRVQAFRAGRTLRATTVAFDRRNDVALLRVAGLAARPLRLRDPRAGAAVAILGYPENGPFDARPGRIGATSPILRRPGRLLPKQITAVRGLIRHGNSGGPAVDASGAVQTTIFAAAQEGEGGYGIPGDLVRAAAAARARAAVSTGDCVS